MQAFRGLLWAGVVLSLLAAAYALLSLVMVASLSGAPIYPLERALFSQRVWLALLIGAWTIGVVCAAVLLRGRGWRAR